MDYVMLEKAIFDANIDFITKSIKEGMDVNDR